jgi:hypothetical protein
MILTLAPSAEPLAVDETRVDEVLRALIAAWGVVSARVLLDRACAWLKTEREDDRALVRARLDALEDCGDVIAGPQGMLAAGPVLEIEMAGGRRLLVGGVPDEVIRESVAEIEIVPGAPRRIERTTPNGVATHFAGQSIPGSRWAGLDDAPIANDALLHALRQRAEAAAAEATLEVLDPMAQRYRPAPERGTRRWPWSDKLDAGLPTLVRWTGLSGDPRFGWAVSSTQVLPLGRDEALRATWAIERASGTAPRIAPEHSPEGVSFSLDPRLPSPEYRYLIASGCEVTRDPTGSRWSVPQSAWAEIRAVLQERLGIVESEAVE